MKISLFTQSLFDLSLEDAVRTAGEIGFDGVEIACFGPHLNLKEAREKKDRIVKLVRDSHLVVSALSMQNNFTDSAGLRDNVELLNGFIALAPDYGTDLIKITPGPPASSRMTDSHLKNWQKAMSECVSAAKEAGVKLAVETHMRMIGDTTASVKRLMDGFDKTLGVNLDFCNVYSGGDNPAESVRELKERLLFSHVKNISGEQWVPLAEGELDYGEILSALRQVGYDGYLSIECLYEVPIGKMIEMVEADYNYLRSLLAASSP